jgi:hypothetical protein
MEPTSEAQLALAQRLERGEILTFSPCPFQLPSGADHAFLLAQRPGGSGHKDISLNPGRNTVSGFVQESPAQAERLCRILRTFAGSAGGWLAALLPRYAASWQMDRVTFRPEEEAIRKLRLTARNDLLHFDAFPSRPTRGRRILRLFVNIHPSDSRVWATGDSFARVLEKYGAKVGFPGPADDGLARRLGRGLLSLFQPGAAERTPYDTFMLRLHHFVKTCDEFQERAPRRLWRFPAGSAWLVFTDATSRAELRGQYALEHSFFIAPEALVLPEESPAALLEKACGAPILPQAA